MKLRLDIEELTEDFFIDSRLFGIISSIKNYQFCWQLNNLLGYNFRLNPEIEIQLKKKDRNYFFPIYEHKVKNNTLCFYLYHNQFDGEYLLPEFRHIDFLWLIKGECINDEQYKTLIEPIKTINSVQLVAELTLEMIRNKSHLIF